MKNTKKKRVVFFSFLVILVTLCLVGISVAGAVEIELWHFGGLDTELGYIPKVVADFEAANPDITVKRTQFPWDARLEKMIVAHRERIT